MTALEVSQHTAEELVLTNARVVTPGGVVTGSVVVRDGAIAEIADGAATRGVDLGGDYLLPGLVELHTDHLEGHFTPRPGTRWDPIPALLAGDGQFVAAGMTTVLDAVRIDGADGALGADAVPREMAAAIRYASDAGITRAEHFIHLRCEVSEPGTVAEFEALAAGPGVRLASLMDHTPGQRQYADPEAYRRYVVGKGRVRPDEFDALVVRRQQWAAVHSVPNRRAIAELATARGLTLAAHDDATVEHARESASFGVRISEFPTTAVAARAARELGQMIVMGAPNIVRGGSQSGNVSAAELLGLGLLDVLSSDYVPASPLQAVLQLHADGTLPLSDGVRLVSSGPARAVGLDDRGEIAVGQRADLVHVHAHALPGDHRHPRGRCVPVVRRVLRAGTRVA